MADWTGPAFVDALTATIAARADILAMANPGVTVLSYDPGIDAGQLGDLVVVGHRVNDTNEPATFQSAYAEEVDVSCFIQVVRLEATDNAGGASAAARLRVADILGAFDNTLRTNDYQDAGSDLTVGDQTIIAWITNRDMFLLPSFDGAGNPVQVCHCNFTVRYEAHTSASSS